MTFKESIEADMDVFFNTSEFAVSATYRPGDGGDDIEDIAVIPSYGQGDEYQGSGNWGIHAVMRVQVSDVDQPESGDLIIIGSLSWGLIGADRSGDGSVWICQVNKVTL